MIQIQERIIISAIRIRDENKDIDPQNAVMQAFIIFCQKENKKNGGIIE